MDGDAMGFTVLTPPAHGTLSGTAPTLAYAPAAGFSGEDAFTFRVSDGQAGSAPASVTIRVGDPKPVKSAYGCSSGGGASPVLLLGGLALLVRGGRGRRRVVALALAVALPCAPLAATSSPSSGRNGATRQAAPPAKPPADVPLPPPPPGTIQVAPAPMPPAPAAARPAPAAAKGARVRVAVMPIRAGPGVDRGIAGLVTDALVAELADRGLQTITAKDVESALGFERQKQLLGCGDSACLADVAGALGADRVVFGDVAQVRELTVFSAQVFNTRAGAVERRFHERLTGGDAADLLEATDRAAGTLFPETARSGTASRRRSTTFSAARPLAVVLRGGYDVRDPGGFGAAAVEYRVSRALRVGAGALMAGSQAAGALLRAGWYPLVLGGTSIYAAAEGQVLFPGEPVVAAHLGLGVEWALGQRLAVSLEAPVTILASAPAEYRSTYFMPGGSVSWRF